MNNYEDTRKNFLLRTKSYISSFPSLLYLQNFIILLCWNLIAAVHFRYGKQTFVQTVENTLNLKKIIKTIMQEDRISLTEWMIKHNVSTYHTSLDRAIAIAIDNYEE